jgi:hypothetical protein
VRPSLLLSLGMPQPRHLRPFSLRWRWLRDKICMCLHGRRLAPAFRSIRHSGLTDSGSSHPALTKPPFSPHFSHFCGLQRPSLVKPQEHFQVAMLSHLLLPMRVTCRWRRVPIEMPQE